MWINNVLIEDGFYNENEEVFVKTKNVSILIEDGHIKDITEEKKEGIDLKNHLVLPALIDNHIHLDKGFYGADKFHAVVPKPSDNYVFHRIEEERNFLKDFLKYIDERANALIDLITGNGAVKMRVQVNADPVIELENYKKVKKVLLDNKDRLDFEMVAFVQHGLLGNEKIVENMLDQGCEILGGLDPATIDYDIEKSLKTTFEIATKRDVPIDIHLHNQASLGLYEIERLMYYIDKFNYKNKVTISHGLALGSLNQKETKDMAKKFKDLGISINSTVPLNSKRPDIITFADCGIKVNIVNDNINDHWSPFGTGDLVERASRAAEVFGQVSMKELCDMYKFISITGDRKVEIGQKANLLFTSAKSSAELIARNDKDRIVMKDGKFINRKFKSIK
ncbi:MAG: amidohydrolase [Tissierellia bacterium]|nr:amidohydrolase [Tissierellia bacterium]